MAALASRFVHAIACAALALAGCGEGDSPPDASSHGAPRAIVLNSELQAPRGMAFLPGGEMLVTQKAGGMVILSADGKSIRATLSGLPAVEPYGGLLDVALDPDFSANAWLYWAYSEPGTGLEAGLAGTAVARGRLVGDRLVDVTVIYRQTPKLDNIYQFGARLAFRADGTLFVTLGDRRIAASAQDLTTTLGKVIRIHRDGAIPHDNPWLPGALPEIWSYGHRNPQGAAIRPDRDQLWINEHGPRGGDELNLSVPGGNYGWPLVSYGCDYEAPVGGDCRLGGGTHAPRFTEPVGVWAPDAIAPSGLLFYTGNGFPH